jgi:hypothetical protein
MLSEIRPSFEVVKEGRILNFISGYRRFVVNEILNLNLNLNLIRFAPCFGKKWIVLIIEIKWI